MGKASSVIVESTTTGTTTIVPVGPVAPVTAVNAGSSVGSAAQGTLSSTASSATALATTGTNSAFLPRLAALPFTAGMLLLLLGAPHRRHSGSALESTVSEAL